MTAAGLSARLIRPLRYAQHGLHVNVVQSTGFVRGGAASYSTRIPAGRGSRLPRRRSPPLPSTSKAGKALESDPRRLVQSADEAHATEQLGAERQDSAADRSLPVLEHATVVVPRSEQGGVIDRDEDVRKSVEAILGQPTLVVTRQMEMLNVFLGYEQANKYALVTPEGQSIGFLAESESGLMGGAMRRQFLRTHRAFEAQVLDTTGRVVMSFTRPTTLINSKLKVFVGSGEEAQLVGEVHQIWHLYRRKYELFVNRPEWNEGTGAYEDSMVQFASIDGALLTWDFLLHDEANRPLGAITRNFRGFGRELFTDTGQYLLTFDPSSSFEGGELRLEGPHTTTTSREEGKQQTPLTTSTAGRELVTSGPARTLTMDERAVAMATAVSIDFDYFSRHSNSHSSPGLPMFPFIWGSGGGGAAEGPAPTSPEGTPSTGAEAGEASGSSNYPDLPQGGQSDELGAASQQPWWGGTANEPAQGGDYGQGQEDVWGGANSQDPWQQGSSSPGGGSSDGGGWSWTDLFPGDE